MTFGVLTGLILATGVLLAIHGLTPANPDLQAAIGRLHPNPATPAPAPPPRGVKERLGAWAEHALAGRRGFATPTQDLQLIGRTSRWYWAEKASSALAGLVIPLLLTLFNRLIGSPLPDSIPVLASFVGGVYFWFLPDTQVRALARAGRAEFARAAVAYLQLLAIHRRAGSGPATAMRGAAEVSGSWMFIRIREEIARSTLAGVDPWDGITELAERIGIPELREVGDIMRLAGTRAGAGVAETLLGRARGLRDEILAAEHGRAISRTTVMNLPVIVLVLLIGLAIAIPAAAALLAA